MKHKAFELTKKIRLCPTANQLSLITNEMNQYIHLINDLLDYYVTVDDVPELTSKINAPIPSAVKNQAIREAKSIYRRFVKGEIGFPVLKKLVVCFNNQNFKFDKKSISFPVWENGKSKRITVRALITDEQYAILGYADVGALRISFVNQTLVAQIAYKPEIRPCANDGVMGVDLGLKVPAVCYADGKVLFVGNGRQNRYIKQKFNSRRRKLGKAKKIRAIRKSKNKEQRILKDIDHKISRQIVNFAKANNIGMIKMEELSGIRAATRKSRKNNTKISSLNKALNSWSFNRLASFIEYKAKMEGIQVQYIDPAFTSQKCPHCGNLNHADDRSYKCSCGFSGHRDLVGAFNIANA